MVLFTIDKMIWTLVTPKSSPFKMFYLQSPGIRPWPLWRIFYTTDIAFFNLCKWSKSRYGYFYWLFTAVQQTFPVNAGGSWTIQLFLTMCFSQGSDLHSLSKQLCWLRPYCLFSSYPSCLLLTLCQKFLLLFQIQQNLLHLSCSSS